MKREVPVGKVVVTGKARAAGRRLGDDGGDAVFLLVRHANSAEILEPVRRAATAALEAASASLALTDPEWEDEPGRFTAMAVPAGVLLTLVQPDPYDLIIATIARALGEEGVSCRISTTPHVQPFWTGAERVDCFEVRIRLAGSPDPTRATTWSADPAAAEAAIDAALRWLSRGTGLAERVVVSAGWALRVETGIDGSGALFRNAVRATSAYHSTSIYRGRTEGWRGAALKLPAGRLTLMGGPSASQAGLVDMTAALEDSAEWAVYGFAKRGDEPLAAELGTSLRDDWLLDSHWVGSAFGDGLEHRFARDAFGLQLFGSRHAGRDAVLPSTHWVRTPLPNSAELVAARSPDDWFSATLPKEGAYRQARRDFREFLMTEEMILDWGSELGQSINQARARLLRPRPPRDR